MRGECAPSAARALSRRPADRPQPTHTSFKENHKRPGPRARSRRPGGQPPRSGGGQAPAHAVGSDEGLPVLRSAHRFCGRPLFIVLTGARLTEATHATWSEIDRPKRVWQVFRPSHEAPPWPRCPSVAAGLRGAHRGRKPQAQRLAHLRASRLDGRGAAAESAHGLRCASAARPARCRGPSNYGPRGAHSRFPGHALTPTGVMAIRCKQFHLPDL